MVSDIRSDGGVEFWVFNTKYLEIYHFKATRISEFDVQIDLNNALENQHVHTAVFVLHMKNINIRKMLLSAVRFLCYATTLMLLLL